MDAILRVALKSNEKWVAGTVLERYDLGEKHPFEWGDKAHFLIVKAEITEEQLAMIPDRKLKIPLDSFLSFESMEKYVANTIMKEAEFAETGTLPKLDKIVDGVTFGCLTPERYWRVTPLLEEIESALVRDPKILEP